MIRRSLIFCLALSAVLSLSAVSEAHKVNVFAYVDGNTVVTESGYSRKNRVHEGVIEVYDAATGALLLSGTTDAEGNYTFPIPDEAREKKMDLRVLLKAGVGHQADWTLKYAEYGDTAPEAASAAPAPAEVAAPAAIPSAAVALPVAGTLTAEQVKAIVHQEMEPVKRMLAELNETGPTVNDVLGGIGYIFGLFGIVAYMKSRGRAG